MNAVASTKPAKTQAIQTTLFDLISAMQQQATTPLEEALIVPKVVALLRGGRLQLEPDYPLQTVA